jgi:small subunit ribosomal protein S1
VGTRVAGRVTRIQPFGAFIELLPGVDGLAHISELGADRRINNPQEVVSIGDQVQATVLSVDMEKHRVGLSLNTDRKGGEEDTRPEVTAANYGKPTQGFGTLGDLLKESMKKK